jgi:hypothetical protein
MRLFGYHHDSRIEALRPKVAEAYKDFISKQGELFEDKIVPMDAAELADTAQRKKKVLAIITYIAVSFAALVIAVSFLGGVPDGNNLLIDFGKVLLIGLVAGGVYYLTNDNYNRVLKAKTKRVVTGVITDIFYTDDDGPAFELSFTEMVIVFSKQYRDYLPGDIVSIVIYSERETMMKRNIIKIGNLFNYQSTTVNA